MTQVTGSSAARVDGPGQRRIAVVGCGGSGKSYVARQLGERLNLRVTHLDAIFYDAEWQSLPPADFAARQHQLVAEPSWIIEGNYASTLPIRLARADTVIVLDLPAATCLRGILARHLRHGGGQHAQRGIYNRITLGFLRYVLTYRRRMLPRVDDLLAQHAEHAKIVRLKSRSAVRDHLSKVL